jgi:hypothetical protein
MSKTNMDGPCPMSTFFDFSPRKGDWKATTRDQIALKGNEVGCLRGLYYESNSFRIRDSDKMFIIDYLPFKTFYSPWTRDSIRVIAARGITLRMFLELLKVVENCGHVILAVAGFDDRSGDLRVPGAYRHLVTHTRAASLPRHIKDDYSDVCECHCEDDRFSALS